jgi:hypothetical protein
MLHRLVTDIEHGMGYESAPCTSDWRVSYPSLAKSHISILVPYRHRQSAKCQDKPFTVESRLFKSNPGFSL